MERRVMGSRLDRISGDVKEWILMQTQCSPRPWIGIAARGVLTLPLQLRGEARRYAASVDGEALGVLTIGREGSLHLPDRVLDSVGEPEPMATGWLWRPRKLLAPFADLVISEIHPLAASRFRNAGWIVVPHAVRFEASLASIPPSRPSHSLAEDLRRVRNRGFALERAGSPEDWDEFFSDMVIPLARQRFGREGWVPNPRLRRDLASLATLLFVHTVEGRVAGICVVPTGTKAWTPALGVKGADRRLVREGAVAAMYFGVIELARAEGLERVDFGRASPFLNDGLHRYKRKWGLVPTMDRIVQLSAVWLHPDHAALRRAFAREPLLTHANGRLRVFAG
jgi:hypothetical protein